MDIMKKIKEIISGQDRRKLIENTVIIAIIGIIILIAGSTIFSSGKKTPANRQKQDDGNTAGVTEQSVTQTDVTEEKLRSLLSQIQGVGKVDVMITYETSNENIPAYDIKKSISSTDERDREGGTRNITQEEHESTVVFEDSADGKKPVVLTQLKAEVKGVLVVAEGADSVLVKERVTNAVTVVLGVPVHKVQVIQRKNK